MYTIEELNLRLLSELKEIAEDIGLKNFKKLSKKDIIYKILNHQAENPESVKKWFNFYVGLAVILALAIGVFVFYFDMRIDDSFSTIFFMGLIVGLLLILLSAYLTKVSRNQNSFRKLIYLVGR
jgi:transcription termination factor Rho